MKKPTAHAKVILPLGKATGKLFMEQGLPSPHMLNVLNKKI